MKKFLYTLLIIGLSVPSYGQVDSTTTVENRIRTANDLKSGNLQDVFTNFFQIAAEDLTGKGRSFDFKSTLFALRVKTDPTLTVDTNYVKHNFDRNLQFNISVKLDQKFKFNGFSGGFTWAIINDRDSTILSFADPKYNTLIRNWDTLKEHVAAERAAYGQSVHSNENLNVGSNEASRIFDTVKMAIKAVLSSGNIDTIKSYSKNVQDSLDKHVPSIKRYYTAYINEYNKALAECRLKPLFTVSLNGGVDSNGRVSNGNFEAVYLQGTSKNGKGPEIDVRLRANIVDTFISTQVYRSTIGFTGGFNLPLIRNKKTTASILEFKPYFEYYRILHGIVPGEKGDMFLANATLRLRITEQLWIPLTIKYDIQNANVFGVFNVALNLDAFKSFIKS